MEHYVVGEIVKVKHMCILAHIIQIEREKIVLVSENQMSMKVTVDQISKIKNHLISPLSLATSPKYQTYTFQKKFFPTIDLHNLTLTEALQATNFFLDQALLFASKADYLTIIHGKGKGILKKKIRMMLQERREFTIITPFIENEGLTMVEFV